MKKKTAALANTKSTSDVNVPAREGFIFYLSFYKALNTLPPRARLRLYDTIVEYALLGTYPTDPDPSLARLFELIRPQLDANERKRKQRFREKTAQDNSFSEFSEFSEKTAEDETNNTLENNEIEVQ